MAIRVNSAGVSHAKSLIRAGKVDRESDWSFEAADGNKILDSGGWSEYKKWFLAEDTEANEETKERYKFPFGKNGKVYRRGVIAAKQRAAQQGYNNIMEVADELLGMIDKEEKQDQAYKVMRIGVLTRNYEIGGKDIDEERRTVTLSFSSEEPVERWFGYEILDHKKESVDLSRLKRIGALLLNHDPADQVGVIEEVFLDEADRKGRAVVRFGRSAKAQEIFQDVVDGIRKNVSVGYVVKEMVKEGTKDNLDVYRVTRWQPLEISLVSVPADVTVGIGRNYGEREVLVYEQKREEEEKTKEITEETIQEIKKEEISMEEIRNEVIKQEQKRVAEILAIGEKHNCIDLAKKAISEGISVEEFGKRVLETVYQAKKVENPDANVGLSEKEIKQFSIIRAINALLANNWSLAPFEREVSDEVAKRIGKPAQGFYIPYDVMRRDLVKGTGSAGGYTVATDLLAEEFIELLRNKMVVRQMGARVLGGLVGDIAIPSQTGGATAYWVGENTAPTESQQTFGQIVMTPKTVGAFTDISRKLLMQSSIDVEAFVREDLATTIALAIDLIALTGTGTSNQPTGILNTAGVNLVEIGTNGGAPTYEKIVQMETEVAADNADVGSLAYLTNAKVRGKLKTTFINPDYSATPVWTESGRPGVGLVNSYNAYVSNQVPSNLTKGSGTGLSAMIFGNWADLIIAEWGALDVLVDPYTGGAAGTVRIRVLQDIDIAVRHPESFCKMVDIATT